MRKALYVLTSLTTMDAITLFVSQIIGPFPSIVPLGNPTAYRNIYVHVPVSISTYILFTAGFLLALACLIKGEERYEKLAHLFITAGLLVGISTLITGAIWAYESWGSPWNWDPRETGVLMMVLSFSVYLAIRSGVEDPDVRSKVSMVFAVASYATIPLSFSIPYVMPSLHPTFIETSKFLESGVALTLFGSRLVVVPLEISLIIFLARYVKKVPLTVVPVVAAVALIAILQVPPNLAGGGTLKVRVLSGSYDGNTLTLNVSYGGGGYLLVYHGKPPITPVYAIFKGRRLFTLRNYWLSVDGTLKDGVIEANDVRIIPYWGNVVNSLVYAVMLILLSIWIVKSGKS